MDAQQGDTGVMPGQQLNTSLHLLSLGKQQGSVYGQGSRCMARSVTVAKRPRPGVPPGSAQLPCLPNSICCCRGRR